MQASHQVSQVMRYRHDQKIKALFARMYIAYDILGQTKLIDRLAGLTQKDDATCYIFFNFDKLFTKLFNVIIFITSALIT